MFSIKKHKFRLVFLLSCVLLAALAIGVRLYWINAHYPSPKIEIYELNDAVQLGSYEITFCDWQWGNGQLMHQVYPGYRLLPDESGNDYPEELMRLGIAEIQITKIKNDDSTVDLTKIYYESGAWGNMFDAELMYGINPGLQEFVFKLDEGESVKIHMPITMINQQFSDKHWRKIDSRTFYIVLQYYPDKILFKCPVSN